ncbi:MAG: hypothetical protein ACE5KT_03490, partial [Methanosarcinales archaeon]
AILASIFGILPDLDFFIDIVAGSHVHRYLTHSVVIGLWLCILLIMQKRQVRISILGSLMIFMFLWIVFEKESIYKALIVITFLFIFFICSYLAYIALKPNHCNTSIIFIGILVPYLSHVIFDSIVGGSAILFPIPYLLTGDLYWFKVNVFPETGTLPISFWILEIFGAFSAIYCMVIYQGYEKKKQINTNVVFTSFIATIAFYLVDYNYMLSIDLVMGLIAVYVICTMILKIFKPKVMFAIMSTWFGFCLLMIIFSVLRL